MNIIENYIDYAAKYKSPILKIIGSKLIKCHFKNGYYRNIFRGLFNIFIILYF